MKILKIFGGMVTAGIGGISLLWFILGFSYLDNKGFNWLDFFTVIGLGLFGLINVSVSYMLLMKVEYQRGKQ